MATIGTLTHELGHNIGLPDLYDRDGSSQGAGTHCLMASGSWANAPGEYPGASPTHLCAWSKIQMGFLTPTVITARGHTLRYRLRIR